MPPALPSAAVNSGTVALVNQLAALQGDAAVVSRLIFTTNLSFYKLLAEVYLWWRAANEDPDFLRQQYAKTGKKFKKKVKYGINFAPLFWLVWGTENDLNDDKVGRYSRVLNRLHEEFETDPQYVTEPVPKLQNFIHQSGGVDGLVNYGDDGDDEEDEEEVEPRPDMTEEMLATLYQRARDFYNSQQPANTLPITDTVPVTSDGLGLVLVRRVGKRYQLVGASRDEDMVKPVVMQTYLNDFTALSPSVRLIVETLSTQCLPAPLQKFYANLIDDAVKAPGSSGLKARRRLLYRHESRDFLLSPIRASSGVVTVAKPSTAILEGASQDLFLSNGARHAFEKRLIAGRDFNLYEPNVVDTIPVYPREDLASHVLRLQDIFDQGHFVHVDWWPFYDPSPAPLTQLCVKVLPASFGQWQAALDTALFRRLSLEFTEKWIATHGTHIKRDHQKVFKVELTRTLMTVHFVYREGVFDGSLAVDLSGYSVSGSNTVVHVLSKDFAIAMKAVADIGPGGQVLVAADADLVVVVYKTDAAEYRIHIPTCSVDGVRSTKYLDTYQSAAVADSFEDYNDQAEGDFDAE
ncbi:MAG: hypothetical protein Q8S02_10060 [Hydrogenophaga sp.]|nr:hypothetical protein [Hydrogenophaga sp.]